MIGPLLALIFGLALYWITRSLSNSSTTSVVALVMGGYVLRVALSFFVRDLPLFSHGVALDNLGYEMTAKTIARLWSYDHVHYVTTDEYPGLGRTSFPPNLFAIVIFLNGEATPLGCTSIIAFLACVSCFNIFALAIESGAELKGAMIVLATLLVLPSFLFYTSDMFKDGIVQFCVVGIVGSALRLSRGFAMKHLVFAVACLLVLSGSRFYLVYATLAPLGLGLLGWRSGSALRMIVSAAALGGALLAFVSLTKGADSLFEEASSTYERGTSRESRDANAIGGSGVQIEGSGGASYAQALVYTLFAPFFWQGGSIGLQMGKIDAFVWYGLVYAAIKGAGRLRKRPTELVILLSFIVPTTFAYAAGFSNIGLTVRERLGVVMVTALLAAMGAARAGSEETVLPEPEGFPLRLRSVETATQAAPRLAR
jgi:hypothetical protein